ncbi:MAG: TolC family protein [Spirochaetales bacterium]|nr:TolC family protein [Spirochaetales bacterium]
MADRSLRSFSVLGLVLFFIFPPPVYPADEAAKTRPAYLLSSEKLFTDTLADNRIYQSILSDFELEQMRALRAEIEARDELGELSAREVELSARIEYREQLEDFLLDLLDSAFAVETALLDREAAQLGLKIAEEDLRQSRARFSSGQIPRTELMEAEVAFKTAELARETALWNYQDAEQDFLQIAEIPWQPDLLPSAETAERPVLDAESWFRGDATVRRAELRLKQRQLHLQGLPSNTPLFSRRLAEKEEEQARLAFDREISLSERRFEQLRRTIYQEGETLKLRADEIAVYSELVKTAERNLEQGLITQGAFERIRVQLLQAERRARQTLQKYLSALISYSIWTEEISHIMTDQPGGESP